MTGHNTPSFAGSGRAATASAAPRERGRETPTWPGRTDGRGRASCHTAAQRQNGWFEGFEGEKVTPDPLRLLPLGKGQQFPAPQPRSAGAPGRAGPSGTESGLADEKRPREPDAVFLPVIYIIWHCLTPPFVLIPRPCGCNTFYQSRPRCRLAHVHPSPPRRKHLIIKDI